MENIYTCASQCYLDNGFLVMRAPDGSEIILGCAIWVTRVCYHFLSGRQYWELAFQTDAGVTAIRLSEELVTPDLLRRLRKVGADFDDTGIDRIAAWLNDQAQHAPIVTMVTLDDLHPRVVSQAA